MSQRAGRGTCTLSRCLVSRVSCVLGQVSWLGVGVPEDELVEEHNGDGHDPVERHDRRYRHDRVLFLRRRSLTQPKARDGDQPRIIRGFQWGGKKAKRANGSVSTLPFSLRTEEGCRARPCHSCWSTLRLPLHDLALGAAMLINGYRPISTFLSRRVVVRK